MSTVARAIGSGGGGDRDCHSGKCRSRVIIKGAVMLGGLSCWWLLCRNP